MSSNKKQNAGQFGKQGQRGQGQGGQDTRSQNAPQDGSRSSSRSEGSGKDSDFDSDNDSRGFAGMDPEKQRDAASKGGKAAHESGNAHEFDSEEARKAGRKSHDKDSQNGSRSSGESGR